MLTAVFPMLTNGVEYRERGGPRSAPTTWLAKSGWRVRGRGGPISLHELPRFA